ncbi:xanthine dehydrogenase family protein molybdopterin-binding subunit [Robbsia sp. Bb-Pol-6]|uniref:Xanthine dehydrogenase family protein molybdopterin-binding subunit n=1 Tax=Robbsia betulipollinis TaxID=2981849 RepID=A0ABT3ZI31_9BURK|nr:xanthine dehydrogenase family protein molybdopterin-binding subunit [Robbsia betulipollinis]MCY0386179.1 xanthine dehydrogenase family protein molybdopterin-binding subunit [Robbsia betulipollinis]
MPSASLILGHPHRRIDGVAKVTGTATFALDEAIPRLAHAVVVTSPIGQGRIRSIDTRAAFGIDGVLEILTWENVGDAIRPVGHVLGGGYANSTLCPLASPVIHYAGQIVALVAAHTREAAQEAAARLAIRYETAAPGVYSLDDARLAPRALADLKDDYADPQVGDTLQGLAASVAYVDACYATPIQHHNPIELPGTTCVWEGDRLTVYEPTRFVGAVRHGLAAQLGIDADHIRVIARFIGGHFGSKLGLSQYTAPVALAARRIGRPLTLQIGRRDSFTVATHRTETRHRVQLGADARGHFTALVHEAGAATSRFDLFAMEGVDVTSALYRCPNVRTREHIAQVDRNTPGPMRAPPEVPYLFALESAVDELAHRLGRDPIELRRINDTRRDTVSGKPFTTRPLMRCFDAGAAAFGWTGGPRATGGPGAALRPAARRDGDWLIGRGCASAARPVKTAAAMVRVTLCADGCAGVATAHHEIGNGLTTLLAMTLADRLGWRVDAVHVQLGDTALPPAGLSGGSATSTSLVNALGQACAQIRDRLLAAATRDGGALAGSTRDALRFADGAIRHADGRALPLATLLADAFGGRIDITFTYLPAGADAALIGKLERGIAQLSTPRRDKLAWAFGAQFVEVRVHALTGQIRVPRMVGAFAAGRILNPLAARAQVEGGMVWGLGSALLECTDIDARTGHYPNASLGDYLVPCAADVGELSALFVDDDDREVNPEGVKGLGEIGIIGVNAAIANAVFDATGKRIRRLPIRCEDLL